MWKEAEYSIKPEELDTTSSSKFVYIRKDIQLVTKDEGEVYVCKEQQLLKEDFELYSKVLGHDTELSEVRDAVIELSVLVAGV